jgi:hypothetical protein
MRPVYLNQSDATTSLDAGDDCPDCTPVERTYLTTIGRQQLAERARRELVLGSIRASLQEEPSPRAMRKRARMWCTDIRNIADDLTGGAA